jgi:hypothetical protein
VLSELEKYAKIDPSSVNKIRNMVQIKEYIKTQLQKLDFREQLDFQLAIVCDLNLGYYLVPKRWVKDTLIRHFLRVVSEADTRRNNYLNKDAHTGLL